MLERTFCKKCGSFHSSLIIQSDSSNSVKTSQDSFCPFCRTYILSTKKQSLEPTNSITNPKDILVDFPKQTIYIHLDDQTLNVFEPDKSTPTINDYSDKNVLLIGCGAHKRVIVLQNILKHKFNKIVCLTREKEWGLEYFDDWIIAENDDISQKEDTLRKVQEYMSVNKIEFHAIFTHYDYSVPMTSYLADHFKLPTVPFDVSCSIKNKYEMRRICMAQGISTPNFCLIKSEMRKQLVEGIRTNKIPTINSEKGGQIVFPLIVKNPNGVAKGML
jgi:hypothetical protein